MYLVIITIILIVFLAGFFMDQNKVDYYDPDINSYWLDSDSFEI